MAGLFSDDLSPDDPRPATGMTVTARLIAEARSKMQPELFALLDGALFDDMARLLANYEIRGRPLFLEAGDADAVASGPFLIPLDSAGQVTAVIALVGNGRAPVIWSWPAGEPSLYRHLRTLNMAQIPRTVADDDPPDASTPVKTPTPMMAVIFRHWDPNVLALMLPQFTDEQRPRFFGLATSLAFQSRHDADASIAAHPANDTTRPGGMLVFSAEQLAAMSRFRVDLSYRRIKAYLRHIDPELVDRFDEPSLLAQIDQADRSGRALGLVSEQSLGKWTYLHLATGGAISAGDPVREAFQQSNAPPHETLDDLYDVMIAEFEREAGGRG
jgi:hypothetical protein